MGLTRRQLLKSTALGGSAMLLGSPLRIFAQRGGKPHFFLHIHIPGGMDATYLFDARPVRMTSEDRFIQNYLARSEGNAREPYLFEGINGTTSLACDLTKPLLKYRDRFSIINGVHMYPKFDGHPQNANYLYSGDPFGGDYFLPMITNNMPIDYVQGGDAEADVRVTNDGKAIKISPQSLVRLKAKLAAENNASQNKVLVRHLASRMKFASQGAGKFSQGAALMLSGFEQAPHLVKVLRNIVLDDVDMENNSPVDPIKNTRQMLQVATQMFSVGATNAALLGIRPQTNADCHDVLSAKIQETTYIELIAHFEEIFRFLTETAFDDEHSFMDVTTVMITTEFGRTMRNPGIDIMETATEHNAFTNTFILAGKRIKGGVLLGETDTESATAPISDVHRRLDPQHLKIWGRPFDFDTGIARVDSPIEYQGGDYINASHVINTLFEIFGVDKKYFRLDERNGRIARSLTPFLVG